MIRSKATRLLAGAAAYNGHPLYTFVMDQSPGDTKGQGSTAFGGGWFALNRSGNQVTATQSTTTTGSSGGGIGY